MNRLHSVGSMQIYSSTDYRSWSTIDCERRQYILRLPFSEIVHISLPLLHQSLKFMYENSSFSEGNFQPLSPLIRTAGILCPSSIISHFSRSIIKSVNCCDQGTNTNTQITSFEDHKDLVKHSSIGRHDSLQCITTVNHECMETDSTRTDEFILRKINYEDWKVQSVEKSQESYITTNRESEQNLRISLLQSETPDVLGKTLEEIEKENSLDSSDLSSESSYLSILEIKQNVDSHDKETSTEDLNNHILDKMNDYSHINHLPIITSSKDYEEFPPRPSHGFFLPEYQHLQDEVEKKELNPDLLSSGDKETAVNVVKLNSKELNSNNGQNNNAPDTDSENEAEEVRDFDGNRGGGSSERGSEGAGGDDNYTPCLPSFLFAQKIKKCETCKIYLLKCNKYESCVDNLKVYCTALENKCGNYEKMVKLYCTRLTATNIIIKHLKEKNNQLLQKITACERQKLYKVIPCPSRYDPLECKTSIKEIKVDTKKLIEHNSVHHDYETECKALERKQLIQIKSDRDEGEYITEEDLRMLKKDADDITKMLLDEFNIAVNGKKGSDDYKEDRTSKEDKTRKKRHFLKDEEKLLKRKSYKKDHLLQEREESKDEKEVKCSLTVAVKGKISGEDIEIVTMKAESPPNVTVKDKASDDKGKDEEFIEGPTTLKQKELHNIIREIENLLEVTDYGQEQMVKILEEEAIEEKEKEEIMYAIEKKKVAEETVSPLDKGKVSEERVKVGEELKGPSDRREIRSLLDKDTKQVKCPLAYLHKSKVLEEENVEEDIKGPIDIKKDGSVKDKVIKKESHRETKKKKIFEKEGKVRKAENVTCTAEKIDFVDILEKYIKKVNDQEGIVGKQQEVARRTKEEKDRKDALEKVEAKIVENPVDTTEKSKVANEEQIVKKIKMEEKAVKEEKDLKEPLEKKKVTKVFERPFYFPEKGEGADEGQTVEKGKVEESDIVKEKCLRDVLVKETVTGVPERSMEFIDKGKMADKDQIMEKVKVDRGVIEEKELKTEKEIDSMFPERQPEFIDKGKLPDEIEIVDKVKAEANVTKKEKYLKAPLEKYEITKVTEMPLYFLEKGENADEDQIVEKVKVEMSVKEEKELRTQLEKVTDAKLLKRPPDFIDKGKIADEHQIVEKLIAKERASEEEDLKVLLQKDKETKVMERPLLFVHKEKVADVDQVVDNHKLEERDNKIEKGLWDVLEKHKITKFKERKPESIDIGKVDKEALIVDKVKIEMKLTEKELKAPLEKDKFTKGEERQLECTHKLKRTDEEKIADDQFVEKGKMQDMVTEERKYLKAPLEKYKDTKVPERSTVIIENGKVTTDEETVKTKLEPRITTEEKRLKDQLEKGKVTTVPERSHDFIEKGEVVDVDEITDKHKVEERYRKAEKAIRDVFEKGIIQVKERKLEFKYKGAMVDEDEIVETVKVEEREIAEEKVLNIPLEKDKFRKISERLLDSKEKAKVPGLRPLDFIEKTDVDVGEIIEKHKVNEKDRIEKKALRDVVEKHKLTEVKERKPEFTGEYKIHEDCIEFQVKLESKVTVEDNKLRAKLEKKKVKGKEWTLESIDKDKVVDEKQIVEKGILAKDKVHEVKIQEDEVENKVNLELRATVEEKKLRAPIEKKQLRKYKEWTSESIEKHKIANEETIAEEGMMDIKEIAKEKKKKILLEKDKYQRFSEQSHDSKEKVQVPGPRLMNLIEKSKDDEVDESLNKHEVDEKKGKIETVLKNVLEESEDAKLKERKSKFIDKGKDDEYQFMDTVKMEQKVTIQEKEMIALLEKDKITKGKEWPAEYIDKQKIAYESQVVDKVKFEEQEIDKEKIIEVALGKDKYKKISEREPYSKKKDKVPAFRPMDDIKKDEVVDIEENLNKHDVDEKHRVIKKPSKDETERDKETKVTERILLIEGSKLDEYKFMDKVKLEQKFIVEEKEIIASSEKEKIIKDKELPQKSIDKSKISDEDRVDKVMFEERKIDEEKIIKVPLGKEKYRKTTERVLDSKQKDKVNRLMPVDKIEKDEVEVVDIDEILYKYEVNEKEIKLKKPLRDVIEEDKLTKIIKKKLKHIDQDKVEEYQFVDTVKLEQETLQEKEIIASLEKGKDTKGKEWPTESTDKHKIEDDTQVVATEKLKEREIEEEKDVKVPLEKDKYRKVLESTFDNKEMDKFPGLRKMKGIEKGVVVDVDEILHKHEVDEADRVIKKPLRDVMEKEKVTKVKERILLTEDDKFGKYEFVDKVKLEQMFTVEEKEIIASLEKEKVKKVKKQPSELLDKHKIGNEDQIVHKLQFVEQEIDEEEISKVPLVKDEYRRISERVVYSKQKNKILGLRPMDDIETGELVDVGEILIKHEIKKDKNIKKPLIDELEKDRLTRVKERKREFIDKDMVNEFKFVEKVKFEPKVTTQERGRISSLEKKNVLKGKQWPPVSIDKHTIFDEDQIAESVNVEEQEIAKEKILKVLLEKDKYKKVTERVLDSKDEVTVPGLRSLNSIQKDKVVDVDEIVVKREMGEKDRKIKKPLKDVLEKDVLELTTVEERKLEFIEKDKFGQYSFVDTVKLEPKMTLEVKEIIAAFEKEKVTKGKEWPWESVDTLNISDEKVTKGKEWPWESVDTLNISDEVEIAKKIMVEAQEVAEEKVPLEKGKYRKAPVTVFLIKEEYDVPIPELLDILEQGENVDKDENVDKHKVDEKDRKIKKPLEEGLKKNKVRKVEERKAGFVNKGNTDEDQIINKVKLKTKVTVKEKALRSSSAKEKDTDVPSPELRKKSPISLDKEKYRKVSEKLLDTKVKATDPGLRPLYVIEKHDEILDKHEVDEKDTKAEKAARNGFEKVELTKVKARKPEFRLPDPKKKIKVPGQMPTGLTAKNEVVDADKMLNKHEVEEKDKRIKKAFKVVLEKGKVRMFRKRKLEFICKHKFNEVKFVDKVKLEPKVTAGENKIIASIEKKRVTKCREWPPQSIRKYKLDEEKYPAVEKVKVEKRKKAEEKDLQGPLGKDKYEKNSERLDSKKMIKIPGLRKMDIIEKGEVLDEKEILNKREDEKEKDKVKKVKKRTPELIEKVKSDEEKIVDKVKLEPKVTKEEKKIASLQKKKLKKDKIWPSESIDKHNTDDEYEIEEKRKSEERKINEEKVPLENEKYRKVSERKPDFKEKDRFPGLRALDSIKKGEVVDEVKFLDNVEANEKESKKRKHIRDMSEENKVAKLKEGIQFLEKGKTDEDQITDKVKIKPKLSVKEKEVMITSEKEKVSKDKEQAPQSIDMSKIADEGVEKVDDIKEHEGINVDEDLYKHKVDDQDRKIKKELRDELKKVKERKPEFKDKGKFDEHQIMDKLKLEPKITAEEKTTPPSSEKEKVTKGKVWPPPESLDKHKIPDEGKILETAKTDERETDDDDDEKLLKVPSEKDKYRKLSEKLLDTKKKDTVPQLRPQDETETGEGVDVKKDIHKHEVDEQDRKIKKPLKDELEVTTTKERKPENDKHKISDEGKILEKVKKRETDVEKVPLEKDKYRKLSETLLDAKEKDKVPRLRPLDEIEEGEGIDVGEDLYKHQVDDEDTGIKKPFREELDNVTKVKERKPEFKDKSKFHEYKFVDKVKLEPKVTVKEKKLSHSSDREKITKRKEWPPESVDKHKTADETKILEKVNEEQEIDNEKVPLEKDKYRKLSETLLDAKEKDKVPRMRPLDDVEEGEGIDVDEDLYKHEVDEQDRKIKKALRDELKKDKVIKVKDRKPEFKDKGKFYEHHFVDKVKLEPKVTVEEKEIFPSSDKEKDTKEKVRQSESLDRHKIADKGKILGTGKVDEQEIDDGKVPLEEDKCRKQSERLLDDKEKDEVPHLRPLDDIEKGEGVDVDEHLDKQEGDEYDKKIKKSLRDQLKKDKFTKVKERKPETKGKSKFDEHQFVDKVKVEPKVTVEEKEIFPSSHEEKVTKGNVWPLESLDNIIIPDERKILEKLKVGERELEDERDLQLPSEKEKYRKLSEAMLDTKEKDTVPQLKPPDDIEEGEGVYVDEDLYKSEVYEQDRKIKKPLRDESDKVTKVKERKPEFKDKGKIDEHQFVEKVKIEPKVTVEEKEIFPFSEEEKVTKGKVWPLESLDKHKISDEGKILEKVKEQRETDDENFLLEKDKYRKLSERLHDAKEKEKVPQLTPQDEIEEEGIDVDEDLYKHEVDEQDRKIRKPLRDELDKVTTVKERKPEFKDKGKFDEHQFVEKVKLEPKVTVKEKEIFPLSEEEKVTKGKVWPPESIDKHKISDESKILEKIKEQRETDDEKVPFEKDKYRKLSERLRDAKEKEKVPQLRPLNEIEEGEGIAVDEDLYKHKVDEQDRKIKTPLRDELDKVTTVKERKPEFKDKGKFDEHQFVEKVKLEPKVTVEEKEIFPFSEEEKVTKGKVWPLQSLDKRKIADEGKILEKIMEQRETDDEKFPLEKEKYRKLSESLCDTKEKDKVPGVKLLDFIVKSEGVAVDEDLHKYELDEEDRTKIKKPSSDELEKDKFSKVREKKPSIIEEGKDDEQQFLDKIKVKPTITVKEKEIIAPLQKYKYMKPTKWPPVSIDMQKIVYEDQLVDKVTTEEREIEEGKGLKIPLETEKHMKVSEGQLDAKEKDKVPGVKLLDFIEKSEGVAVDEDLHKYELDEEDRRKIKKSSSDELEKDKITKVREKKPSIIEEGKHDEQQFLDKIKVKPTITVKEKEIIAPLQKYKYMKPTKWPPVSIDMQKIVYEDQLVDKVTTEEREIEEGKGLKIPLETEKHMKVSEGQLDAKEKDKVPGVKLLDFIEKSEGVAVDEDLHKYELDEEDRRKIKKPSSDELEKDKITKVRGKKPSIIEEGKDDEQQFLDKIKVKPTITVKEKEIIAPLQKYKYMKPTKWPPVSIDMQKIVYEDQLVDKVTTEEREIEEGKGLKIPLETEKHMKVSEGQLDAKEKDKVPGVKLLDFIEKSEGVAVDEDLHKYELDEEDRRKIKKPSSDELEKDKITKVREKKPSIIEEGKHDEQQFLDKIKVKPTITVKEKEIIAPLQKYKYMKPTKWPPVSIDMQKIVYEDQLVDKVTTEEREIEEGKGLKIPLETEKHMKVSEGQLDAKEKDKVPGVKLLDFIEKSEGVAVDEDLHKYELDEEDRRKIKKPSSDELEKDKITKVRGKKPSIIEEGKDDEQQFLDKIKVKPTITVKEKEIIAPLQKYKYMKPTKWPPVSIDMQKIVYEDQLVDKVTTEEREIEEGKGLKIPLETEKHMKVSEGQLDAKEKDKVPGVKLLDFIEKSEGVAVDEDLHKYELDEEDRRKIKKPSSDELEKDKITKVREKKPSIIEEGKHDEQQFLDKIKVKPTITVKEKEIIAPLQKYKYMKPTKWPPVSIDMQKIVYEDQLVDKVTTEEREIEEGKGLKIPLETEKHMKVSESLLEAKEKDMVETAELKKKGVLEVPFEIDKYRMVSKSLLDFKEMPKAPSLMQLDFTEKSVGVDVDEDLHKYELGEEDRRKTKKLSSDELEKDKFTTVKERKPEFIDKGKFDEYRFVEKVKLEPKVTIEEKKIFPSLEKEKVTSNGWPPESINKHEILDVGKSFDKVKVEREIGEKKVVKAHLVKDKDKKVSRMPLHFIEKAIVADRILILDKHKFVERDGKTEKDLKDQLVKDIVKMDQEWKSELIDKGMLAGEDQIVEKVKVDAIMTEKQIGVPLEKGEDTKIPAMSLEFIEKRMVYEEDKTVDKLIVKMRASEDEKELKALLEKDTKVSERAPEFTVKDMISDEQIVDKLKIKATVTKDEKDLPALLQTGKVTKLTEEPVHFPEKVEYADDQIVDKHEVKEKEIMKEKRLSDTLVNGKITKEPVRSVEEFIDKGEVADEQIVKKLKVDTSVIEEKELKTLLEKDVDVEFPKRQSQFIDKSKIGDEEKTEIKVKVETEVTEKEKVSLVKDKEKEFLERALDFIKKPKVADKDEIEDKHKLEERDRKIEKGLRDMLQKDKVRKVKERKPEFIDKRMFADENQIVEKVKVEARVTEELIAPLEKYQDKFPAMQPLKVLEKDKVSEEEEILDKVKVEALDEKELTARLDKNKDAEFHKKPPEFIDKDKDADKIVDKVKVEPRVTKEEEDLKAPLEKDKFTKMVEKPLYFPEMSKDIDEVQIVEKEKVEEERDMKEKCSSDMLVVEKEKKFKAPLEKDRPPELIDKGKVPDEQIMVKVKVETTGPEEEEKELKVVLEKDKDRKFLERALDFIKKPRAADTEELEDKHKVEERERKIEKGLRDMLERDKGRLVKEQKPKFIDKGKIKDEDQIVEKVKVEVRVTEELIAPLEKDKGTKVPAMPLMLLEEGKVEDEDQIVKKVKVEERITEGEEDLKASLEKDKFTKITERPLYFPEKVEDADKDQSVDKGKLEERRDIVKTKSLSDVLVKDKVTKVKARSKEVIDKGKVADEDQILEKVKVDTRVTQEEEEQKEFKAPLQKDKDRKFPERPPEFTDKGKVSDEEQIVGKVKVESRVTKEEEDLKALLEKDKGTKVSGRPLYFPEKSEYADEDEIAEKGKVDTSITEEQKELKAQLKKDMYKKFPESLPEFIDMGKESDEEQIVGKVKVESRVTKEEDDLKALLEKDKGKKVSGRPLYFPEQSEYADEDEIAEKGKVDTSMTEEQKELKAQLKKDMYKKFPESLPEFIDMGKESDEEQIVGKVKVESRVTKEEDDLKALLEKEKGKKVSGRPLYFPEQSEYADEDEIAEKGKVDTSMTEEQKELKAQLKKDMYKKFPESLPEFIDMGKESDEEQIVGKIKVESRVTKEEDDLKELFEKDKGKKVTERPLYFPEKSEYADEDQIADKGKLEERKDIVKTKGLSDVLVKDEVTKVKSRSKEVIDKGKVPDEDQILEKVKVDTSVTEKEKEKELKAPLQKDKDRKFPERPPEFTDKGEVSDEEQIVGKVKVESRVTKEEEDLKALLEKDKGTKVSGRPLYFPEKSEYADEDEIAEKGKVDTSITEEQKELKAQLKKDMYKKFPESLPEFIDMGKESDEEQIVGSVKEEARITEEEKDLQASLEKDKFTKMKERPLHFPEKVEDADKGQMVEKGKLDERKDIVKTKSLSDMLVKDKVTKVKARSKEIIDKGKVADEDQILEKVKVDTSVTEEEKDKELKAPLQKDKDRKFPERPPEFTDKGKVSDEEQIVGKVKVESRVTKEEEDLKAMLEKDKGKKVSGRPLYFPEKSEFADEDEIAEKGKLDTSMTEEQKELKAQLKKDMYKKFPESLPEFIDMGKESDEEQIVGKVKVEASVTEEEKDLQASLEKDKYTKMSERPFYFPENVEDADKAQIVEKGKLEERDLMKEKRLSDVLVTDKVSKDQVRSTKVIDKGKVADEDQILKKVKVDMRVTQEEEEQKEFKAPLQKDKSRKFPERPPEFIDMGKLSDESIMDKVKVESRITKGKDLKASLEKDRVTKVTERQLYFPEKGEYADEDQTVYKGKVDETDIMKGKRLSDLFVKDKVIKIPERSLELIDRDRVADDQILEEVKKVVKEDEKELKAPFVKEKIMMVIDRALELITKAKVADIDKVIEKCMVEARDTKVEKDLTQKKKLEKSDTEYKEETFDDTSKEEKIICTLKDVCKKFPAKSQKIISTSKFRCVNHDWLNGGGKDSSGCLLVQEESLYDKYKKYGIEVFSIDELQRLHTEVINCVSMMLRAKSEESTCSEMGKEVKRLTFDELALLHDRISAVGRDKYCRVKYSASTNLPPQVCRPSTTKNPQVCRPSTTKKILEPKKHCYCKNKRLCHCNKPAVLTCNLHAPVCRQTTKQISEPKKHCYCRSRRMCHCKPENASTTALKNSSTTDLKNSSTTDLNFVDNFLRRSST
ncbi:uncharacterized protein LOC142319989 [Lycorma delicatula]|uniref:uncharacterized protein LOC142319989 n=1 Tax=Lycorma delicatula TaxID=130591 RepID=UPI003F50E00B